MEIMMQKPTLEMLKNIEIQMHKDMKKIDNIKESCLQQGNDQLKLFKNETRKLKVEFKEEIKKEEELANQQELEKTQKKKEQESQNRKRVEGKAGMFRSEKKPLKIKKQVEVVDQDTLDFRRFIGDVMELENLTTKGSNS